MVPEASVDISRRQFLAAGGLTVAAACFAPSYLMAETEGIVVGAFKEAATAKVTVQNLRRNISVLLGAGGNIAVLTGPDGKLLIDAEIVTARPNVEKAIKHQHRSHQALDQHLLALRPHRWQRVGPSSRSQHTCPREHAQTSSQATRVEGNFRYTFLAAPAGAIPSTVFKDEHTLHANNTTLMLKHYQPAHTDSDISVYFVEADILHTGDTFWNRDYPFIDYWTGGSIDGQIRAAEANIAKVTAKTTSFLGTEPWAVKPT